jgi:general secretion pathway protein I
MGNLSNTRIRHPEPCEGSIRIFHFGVRSEPSDGFFSRNCGIRRTNGENYRPAGLAAPKFRRRRNEGGFTFLEVLVALAIFGFTGMVLASAYLNVLSAQHASVQQDATVADRRLVRQALYAEPTLEKVTAWNELELPEDRTARWRATVTPTKTADLFDVSLEIQLPALKGGQDQTFTETCRLLRPTWSQPADREALRTEARSKLAQRSF